jgi:hypothetical protein
MRWLLASLLLASNAHADPLAGAAVGATSVALALPALGIDDASDEAVAVAILAGGELGFVVGLIAPDELGWDRPRIFKIGLAGALGGLAGSGLAVAAGGDDQAVCIAAVVGLWGGLATGTWLTIVPTRDGLAVAGSF